MSYSKTYNKSTVNFGKDYTKMEGEGFVLSSDLNTTRELSQSLPYSLSKASQIACDYHKRSIDDA